MLIQGAAIVMSLAILTTIAQPQGRSSSGLPQPQAVSLLPSAGALGDAAIQRNQMAQLISARQIQLRVDTAKLVELTAELKRQIHKTDVNILSLDVIKKAQEIQKLAKSVQDKMKNGY